MSLRHLALAAGGVLLLGAGVYLYLEVHAPASAAAGADAPEPRAPGASRPDRAPGAPPAERAPDPAAAAPAGAHRLRLDRPGMLARGVGAASPPEPAPPAAAAEPASPPSTDPNPKLDAVMSEANKAYDRGDFDEASQIAQKVLARDPSNVRMLRVMVSSACQGGDGVVAQRYYAQLPEADQAQMRVRCERYGVSFDPGRAR